MVAEDQTKYIQTNLTGLDNVHARMQSFRAGQVWSRSKMTIGGGRIVQAGSVKWSRYHEPSDALCQYYLDPTGEVILKIDADYINLLDKEASDSNCIQRST